METVTLVTAIAYAEDGNASYVAEVTEAFSLEEAIEEAKSEVIANSEGILFQVFITVATLQKGKIPTVIANVTIDFFGLRPEGLSFIPTLDLKGAFPMGNPENNPLDPLPVAQPDTSTPPEYIGGPTPIDEAIGIAYDTIGTIDAATAIAEAIAAEIQPNVLNMDHIADLAADMANDTGSKTE